MDQGIESIASKRALLAQSFRTLLHQLMTAQIRVADLDLSILDQSVNSVAGPRVSRPSEAGTVQRRIIAYAGEIGWRFVPRVEAEPLASASRISRRLHLPSLVHPAGPRLRPRLRRAGPRPCPEQLANLPATIEGNRRFLEGLLQSIHLLR